MSETCKLKSYILKKEGSDNRYDFTEWNEKYQNYLRELLSGNPNNNPYNDPYNDPDKKSGNASFYKDLAQFLNYQEKNEDRLTEKLSYEDSKDPWGIQVKNNKGQILYYLKSDQLGFSAPKPKENHPYDIYLRQLSEDNKNKGIKKISEWIYYSRTIGGSFLWPMEKNASGPNPYYNVQRGRGKMQDRADLTLLDIRNCFLKIKGSTVDSWLYNRCNDGSNMRSWLEHFGKGKEGFKNYVEFFQFNNFVNDYYIPKDLSNLKDSLEDFGDKKYNKRFKEYSYDELEKILQNLNDLIIERSQNIENILNKS